MIGTLFYQAGLGHDVIGAVSYQIHPPSRMIGALSYQMGAPHGRIGASSYQMGAPPRRIGAWKGVPRGVRQSSPIRLILKSELYTFLYGILGRQQLG